MSRQRKFENENQSISLIVIMTIKESQHCKSNLRFLKNKLKLRFDLFEMKVETKPGSIHS